MTTAPFILFAVACSSLRLGAETVEPGRAVIHAGGGLSGLLPVGQLGVSYGALEDFDLSLRYDVHGGLSHELSIEPRLAVSDRLAFGLNLSHAFVAIEEDFGITLVRTPVGTGMSLSPNAKLSFHTRRRLHISLSSGVSFRLLVPRETPFDGVERRLEPTVHTAYLQIACEWPGDHGSAFVVFRAVVPIQAELKVIGYFPSLLAGYTWDFL